MTPAIDSTTRFPAIVPDDVPAQRHPVCRASSPAVSRLHDAALAFDELLGRARRLGVTDDPAVRRALGEVVDTIAAAITPGDAVEIGRGATVRPAVDAVLLDRAAARFSTRVIGTPIGRRPCPPGVLAALDRAQALVRGQIATTSDDPSVIVVVIGLVRRRRLARMLRLLGDRPARVHLVGTPVRVPSSGTRAILELDVGNSRSGAEVPPAVVDHLAHAHLVWIRRTFQEARHEVVRAEIVDAPHRLLDGRVPTIVIGSGVRGLVGAWRVRRTIRRAGGSIVAE